MRTTLVAQDVPQWAIDALEKIDYDALNTAFGSMILLGFEGWCASQPQKRMNYQAREITTTIPQNIINVINLIDFANMTPQALQSAKDYLTVKAQSALPQKKGQR